jgi:hypothetical protein
MRDKNARELYEQLCSKSVSRIWSESLLSTRIEHLRIVHPFLKSTFLLQTPETPEYMFKATRITGARLPSLRALHSDALDRLPSDLVAQAIIQYRRNGGVDLVRSMTYERLVQSRSKAIADAIRLAEALGRPIVPLCSAAGFLAQLNGKASLPPAPERCQHLNDVQDPETPSFRSVSAPRHRVCHTNRLANALHRLCLHEL